MIKQIINGKVFTPHGWIQDGSVLIKDSRIKEILNNSNPVDGVDEIIDAKGSYVLPGAENGHRSKRPCAPSRPSGRAPGRAASGGPKGAGRRWRSDCLVCPPDVLSDRF